MRQQADNVCVCVCVDMAWLHQSRGSPRLVLVVVCVALLLDNMLLTVVGEFTHTHTHTHTHTVSTDFWPCGDSVRSSSDESQLLCDATENLQVRVVVSS